MSIPEEAPQLPTSCPHCSAATLHVRRICSWGGQGPYLLPGLGHFLHHAHFDVVVCSTCGLTQFFAEPSAREQLPHDEWTDLQRRPRNRESR